MTLDEMKSLPEEEQKILYEKIKSVRGKAKTTGFSCLYGAGPEKISRTGNMSLKEARLLHSVFWKRNIALKKVSEAFVVKEVNSQKWLYNPVSKLWYSLRATKDLFSTGNQSLGVWCFDKQVKNVRSKGIKINLQMHDEILFNLYEEQKVEVEEKLKQAIIETNAEICLNVPLGISIDWGLNYADCH